MAGSSQKDRKKVDVSVHHKCPLNLLPREIWSSSDAVYKHATMSYKPLPHSLAYLDGTEMRFLDRYVEVGNENVILRKGFVEYLQFGRRDKGMELLARASTEGSIEAGYLFAMLLMSDHEDEEQVQRGVQMMEVIHISGQLERCSKFFSGISKDIMVLLLERFASE